MAGNVREWNWNETNAGHLISGGGWSDENYMFTEWDHLPSFDRSPLNGFRCAVYSGNEQIPQSAFRFIEMALRGKMDYSSEITQVQQNQGNPELVRQIPWACEISTSK